MLRLFFFHSSFAELALSPILLMEEEISHSSFTTLPRLSNISYIVKYVKYIIYIHNSKSRAFRVKPNFFWSEIHTRILPNLGNLWFSLQCAQNITNKACILNISKSSLTYLNQTNAAWISSRITKNLLVQEFEVFFEKPQPGPMSPHTSAYVSI